MAWVSEATVQQKRSRWTQVWLAQLAGSLDLVVGQRILELSYILGLSNRTDRDSILIITLKCTFTLLCK